MFNVVKAVEKKINYCHIVPSSFISNSKFHCSHFHLVLSERVEYDKVYRDSYRRLAEKGDVVYLDNDFFENRTCPNIEKLIRRGEMVKATHIILPDILFRDTMHYIRILKNLVSVLPKKFLTSAVVTGNNFQQAIDCFQTLNEMDEIDVICIPDRILMNKIKMKRFEFLNKIEEKYFDPVFFNKPVHLFALDNINELPKLVRWYVVSLDSTMAFKTGVYERKLPLHYDLKRPNNYFQINNLNKQQKEKILFNLKYIDGICQRNLYEEKSCD